jgi:hypothetical protein
MSFLLILLWFHIKHVWVWNCWIFENAHILTHRIISLLVTFLLKQHPKILKKFMEVDNILGCHWHEFQIFSMVTSARSSGSTKIQFRAPTVLGVRYFWNLTLNSSSLVKDLSIDIHMSWVMACTELPIRYY